MKKFFYTFLFLVLLCVFNPVKAEEVNITYQRLEGIYYNETINGNLMSNHVTSFHLNGRIAYCIEPGVDINTRVYDVSKDWSLMSFSEEIKEYIEKVGYYGYEYPGHQTDNYYIAAQELIWRKIMPEMEILWTTGINKTGDIIDISNEKSEIESLVNSHSLKPSFSGSKVTGYLGDEIILTDENNVLDNFEVTGVNNHEIIRENNKLIIKLNSKKEITDTIKLSKKHYDDAPLLIYSRGDSQKLASLRITSDKDTYFTIESMERPVEIVEVPDTGVNLHISECISMIIIGIGLIIGALKFS